MAHSAIPGNRDRGGSKKRLAALGAHLLRQGPQPPEVMIGIVCDAFNCTPDVALRQDMAMVTAILEARLAESARAQHNQDVSKMTPAQVRIWDAMTAAMIAKQEGG